MNISNNISITLTADDIQELIAKEHEVNGYKIDGKISVNTRIQSSGYGMQERDVLVFTSVTCTATKVQFND